jgi:hypothetical protein
MTTRHHAAPAAAFRTESPLEYLRGPGKQRTPEEEAEEAGKRIIEEVNKLREKRKKGESA